MLEGGKDMNKWGGRNNWVLHDYHASGGMALHGVVRQSCKQRWKKEKGSVYGVVHASGRGW